MIGADGDTNETGSRPLLKRLAASPVPVAEASIGIDEVRSLIQTGLVSLRIIQYPWGVEFELEASPGRRKQVQ